MGGCLGRLRRRSERGEPKGIELGVFPSSSTLTPRGEASYITIKIGNKRPDVPPPSHNQERQASPRDARVQNEAASIGQSEVELYFRPVLVPGSQYYDVVLRQDGLPVLPPGPVLPPTLGPVLPPTLEPVSRLKADSQPASEYSPPPVPVLYLNLQPASSSQRPTTPELATNEKTSDVSFVPPRPLPYVFPRRAGKSASESPQRDEFSRFRAHRRQPIGPRPGLLGSPAREDLYEEPRDLLPGLRRERQIRDLQHDVTTPGRDVKTPRRDVTTQAYANDGFVFESDSQAEIHRASLNVYDEIPDGICQPHDSVWSKESGVSGVQSPNTRRPYHARDHQYYSNRELSSDLELSDLSASNIPESQSPVEIETVSAQPGAQTLSYTTAQRPKSIYPTPFPQLDTLNKSSSTDKDAETTSKTILAQVTFQDNHYDQSTAEDGPSPDDILYKTLAPSPAEIYKTLAPSPAEIYKALAPSPAEVYKTPAYKTLAYKAPRPLGVYKTPASSHAGVYKSPVASNSFLTQDNYEIAQDLALIRLNKERSQSLDEPDHAAVHPPLILVDSAFPPVPEGPLVGRSVARVFPSLRRVKRTQGPSAEPSPSAQVLDQDVVMVENVTQLHSDMRPDLRADKHQQAARHNAGYAADEGSAKRTMLESIGPSEHSRLRRYLESCPWALRYFDKKDAFHIGVKDKSHDEARRLLEQEDFAHIPIEFFDFVPATYKKSISPGTHLTLFGNFIVILSCGVKALAKDAKKYLLTVCHLYDGFDQAAVCNYMNNGVMLPCGTPAHLFEEIRVPIPTEPTYFERVTADIALLQPLVPCPNSIVIGDRSYELSLNRDGMTNYSSVMIRDQHGTLKRGHIDSCRFTDKTLNLYNVMTVVDTAQVMPSTITGPGDSGALVLGSIPLNAAYRDVKVCGMVTGILTQGNTSMTIVSRLADVLDHCGVFAPEARAEFVSL